MSLPNTRSLLRPLLLATACVLAFPSMAADRCEHSRTESPSLDLEGITRVVVKIGPDELQVEPGQPQLSVRHCASTPERLDASRFTVERRGDTLHLGSGGGQVMFNVFGYSSYDWRAIALTLPADLPVTLDVGSGEANLRGFSEVVVDLGSGDVALRDVGRVGADVGSGDLVVDGATAVNVEVGSGDAVLRGVEGAVQASVGSGDIEMSEVGTLASLTAGSGSISAEAVRGDVHVRSVGSGDAALRSVRGNVRIDNVGSGDVDVRDVDGDVVVADKHTLENVETRGVRGRVVIGG